MLRRLFVCLSVCGVGFGGWILSAVPASAYSSPGVGVIETIAQTDGGIDRAAVSAAGDIAYSDSVNNVVNFVPASSGTYFGQSMSAGSTYTIAGIFGDEGGFSGDGGPGPSAELSAPTGLLIDSLGDVLFSDTENNIIRVVPNHSGSAFGFPYVAGDIYTLIGTPAGGYSGDGGPGSAAELEEPIGLAADAHGNLLIADEGNQVIRVWSLFGGSFYGQSMTALDIYTIVGSGGFGFSGDGGPALSASFSFPDGVAVDASGDVIVGDTSDHRVRVVAESAGTHWGVAMTVGDVYTVAGNGVGDYNGEGNAATAAELYFPEAVTVDGNGNLLIADSTNHRIRIVPATTGSFYGQSLTADHMYTIAGDGGTSNSGDGGAGTSAGLDFVDSVTVDGYGNVILAAGDRVRIVGGNVPPSEITLSSAVTSATMTATAETQWTITVHNPSPTVSESNVAVQFTVDNGALNPAYSSFANTVNPSGCVSSAGQITCSLGTVGPNPSNVNPPSVSVQIQGVKTLVAGTVIHSIAQVQSNLTPPFGNGNASAESDVTIVAPTPGVVQSFASGQSGSLKIVTDKAPSASATIIAGFKVAKRVRAPGSFALHGGQPNAAAPLVSNLGTPVSLQRLNGTSASFGTLCTGASHCLGDVMQIAPFINQTDPKHPATLTLTWDVSVSTLSHPGTLFIVTDSNPNPVAVPSTCTKTKLGYTTLPCIKKEKAPTTKIGWVFTVLILSSNDPSFGRK